jgi:hypothetical protein
MIGRKEVAMRPTTLQLVAIALVVAVARPLYAVKKEARFEAIPRQSDMRVDGTSTLHDWTVKTPSINGSITFKFDVAKNATAKAVREAIVANPDAEADVNIDVRTLKSTKKDKDMDKKIQEAMKSNEYPQIDYQLTSLKLAKGSKAEQEEFDAETVGSLTIAGVTRELRMPMRLKVVDGKHLQISGETNMKMTDFKIKPPQAMLGMIKSGDKIKVSFEWNVERAEETAPAK